MTIVTDPDLLNDEADPTTSTTEIFINTSARTIGIRRVGNVSAGTSGGVTAKAVYSFIKDQWIQDPFSKNLPAFPFPFTPITDEFYELIEGWNWEGSVTRTLIRNAGFLVRNSVGALVEHWAGVKSTGNTESDDQLYYIRYGTSIGDDSGARNFSFTGAANEPVQVQSDPNGDGNFADGFNQSFNIVINNREQAQLFSTANTQANGESTLLAPKVFALDAGTGSDVNVDVSDTSIAVSASGSANLSPYASISIVYLDHRNRGTWVPGGVYVSGDVVQSSTSYGGRWYYTSNGGTAGADVSAGVDLVSGTDGLSWRAWVGEREIGTSAYYSFGVLIDGANQTKQTIYEAVQYMLRLGINIGGQGTSAVTSGSHFSIVSINGKESSPLLRFVGDQLQTIRQTTPKTSGWGVFIDNTQAADVNDLLFVDDQGQNRTFPRKATVILNSNSNLVADASASYYIYYTDPDASVADNGQEWGASGALLVARDGGGSMTARVSLSTIQEQYDYDNDTTGDRTAATDTPITVIALGTSVAQYVRQTATIVFPQVQVALTGPLERNYT